MPKTLTKIITMEIKEVTERKFKVGFNAYDTKEEAEKVIRILSDENKKLCECCKGVGKAWQARGRHMDNGGDGYTKYFAEYFMCEKCDGRGFLRRETLWV